MWTVRTLPLGLAVLLLAPWGLACRSALDSSGPQIVQPGAPGQPGRVVSAAAAADVTHVAATPADVRFMQGMIAHHSQAVEMVKLLPSRSTSEEMRLLALRIELSQSDEIRMMEQWLQTRGHQAAGPHAHHGADGTMMPGMLSREQMARLAAAKGPEFDRLFLEGMITHHEGALTMVRELFETPGAGQEPEIFAFASDVDADQRMEIGRMRAMLRPR